MSTTPAEKWKWFGNAGHFICGSRCRFHLTTVVGPWLVSTVGQYLPDEGSREIVAQSRHVKLEGRGDAREADYMKKIGYEEIGIDRTFETMVFLAGKPCVVKKCCCGLPALVHPELDSSAYNEAGIATKGHYAMCRKWARRDRVWLRTHRQD